MASLVNHTNFSKAILKNGLESVKVDTTPYSLTLLMAKFEAFLIPLSLAGK
jgi:hypothetical protein